MIETEHGFIVYSYPDKDTVYIEDIYTDADHRESHLATALATRVIHIAKTKGCTKAVGSVVPSTKGSTTSLKVLLAYGMSLNSSSNNFILFSMEI